PPPHTCQVTNAPAYGFSANITPEVDHPRRSPASERRIGESDFFGASRNPTLPFHGYADEVASLYAGMALTAHF
ncbi:mononuclear molybdenum enzyme YedY, partial [Rhizobium ruizarguesonis]